MRQGNWLYLLKIIVLAVVYVAAARIGLSLASVHGNVTLVWPPAGLALAALVLYGIRLWPGIILGTALAVYHTGAPLNFVVLVSAGNTIAAVTATSLMQKFGDFQPALVRIRDVLILLILGIMPAATVSAAVGIVALRLAGMVPSSSLAEYWWVWWLGDAVGILLITPVALAWTKAPERPWHGWRPLEIMFLMAAISATSHTIFMSTVPIPELIYLLFPLLIWISLRFSALEAATASLVASLIAVVGTTIGTSPFLRQTVNESLFVLWSYMGAITLVVLLLSAAMAQRHRAGATHEGFLAQLRSLKNGDDDEDERAAIDRSRAVQSTRLFSILIMVLVTAPFFLLSYESVQRLLATQLTSWHAYVLTIVVGSSVITIMAYLVLRRQGKLYEQILEEILAWRRVEEMRRELAQKALELQETAKALQAEVAERIQAEQTLQRSEERWRTYFEEANDFIFTLDADGRLANLNRAACEALGYTLEEFVGRNPAEFVAPEQRQRTKTILQEVLNGGKIPQVEVEAVAKDGRRLSLEVRGHAFYRDGQVSETFYIGRDITQRKEAERALRESEERNRALLQAIPDLMFLVNEDGVFLDYHLAENNLAWSSLEVIGCHVKDVLPLELSAPLLQHFERALQTDEIQIYEYPLTVEDRARYFEARIVRCGRQQLLTIIRDITDRKEAEESLLKEKAFSESILDTMPGVFALVDNQGQLLQWNQNLERTSGYASEALSQLDVREFFRGGERYKVDQQLELIFEQGHGSVEVNFVDSQDKQTGSHFLTGRRLVLDQEPYAILIGLNIADRKQMEEALRESEERYRMLFRHSPLGILHFDETGTIIDCNDKFVQIIGSSRNALLGFNILEQARDEGVIAAINEALAGNIGYYEDDYLSVTGNKLTPVRASFSRIMTGDGESFGGIGIVEDVSERKRAEQVLLRKQKLESLGVLAGGIAHDFNNLLVAMMGQASLALAHLEVGNPAREHVQKVTNAAQRAADLTRQLLAYSGRGQFETRSIQLNTLIEENLHLFEVAIPKNVQLKPELTKPLPFVKGDPGQMQQVIMNLILNGAEAIGERPGTVTVKTETTHIRTGERRRWHHGNQVKPGYYVVLSVHDNGSGMDKETLAKIFDPFFTTKFTGRGLGLAAVLGIVRGHKGGLQVESIQNEETTFRVFLPASNDESSATSTTTVSNTIQAANGYILVIDDEEAVREAVFDIFEIEGWPTLTASDGKSGLALYQERQHEINLVILDLSMPGLNGAEVLQELQRINPDVQVLLSSGYTEAEITERIGDREAAGFIQKPYTAARLIQAIQKVRFAAG